MAKKECDNTSVGVIIQDPVGRLALFTRGHFPIGVAPAAGHIDSHGSAEQAAVDEVSEELGIKLAVSGLRETAIRRRRVDNICRRLGGTHHIWTVYEASVDDTTLIPDSNETKGAGWYTRDAVQLLANQTIGYLRGTISEREWATQPGLEPVWQQFMLELGYIEHCRV